MSRVIAAFAQFFDGTGQPLENGWLKFTESQSDTLKPTYADANQSIANENPLQLDAEGRCPNCFGQGIYRVVLFENNPVTNVPGAMIQTFDPVTAEYVNTGNGSGNFGDWDIDETYQKGQVVLYGGVYYRSLTANNIGNQPDLNSDQWEVIEFLRYWNADVTYADGDPVFWDSELYFSLSDGNMGNQPDTSPTYWKSTIATAVDFAWSAVEVYDTGYIVYYDGIYYRSLIDSNAGNQPDTNLDKWEIIDFLRTWNDAVTYAADDLILYSGKLYTSLLGSNLNNQPDISPTYWQLYTPYVYWYESGTDWTHTGAAYNIGDATHRVAVIHLDAFDAFPITPSSAPTADYEVANKKYVDDSILQDWEETGTALQPIVSDDQDLGSSSNLVSNVFIANDPTVDEHAVRKYYLDSMLYALKTNKNYFDNPNIEVWQRATSVSATTGVFFAADRVRNVAGGSGSPTIAVSIQAIPYDYSLIPNKSLYYQRNVVVAGTPSADNSVFNDMAILNVEKLSGKQVTFSVYLRSDAARDVSVMINQEFGSGGSATVQTFIDKITLTTAFVRYTFTFTVPSISGLTIGTISATRVRIYYSAGSDFDSITDTLGEQSGTFDIADFQLEDGPIATDFEQIDFNTNLWRCLPYYQKTYNYATLPGTNIVNGRIIWYSAGFNSSTSNNYTIWEFKRPMITTPTVITYTQAGASGLVNVAGGTASPTLIISKERLEVSALDTTATTTRTIYFHATADTGY